MTQSSRRWIHTKLILIICFGVMLTFVKDVEAKSAKEIAKAAFTKGKKAFDNRDLPEALSSFQKAYQSYPLPLMLFNIASTYEQMGQLPKAIKQYELFVQTGKDDGDAVKKLKKLKAQVAQWAEVTIASTPTGASVWVNHLDYPSWGETPLTILVPNQKTLTFSLKAEGYKDLKYEVLLKTQEKRSLSLKMKGKSAFVQILGKPNLTEVKVNDLRFKGLPVTHDIGVGTHEIEFFASGYLPDHRTVTLTSSHTKEAPLSVEVNLRSSKGVALLNLSVDQPKALLFIDGQPAGQSPFTEPIECTEGSHLIELRGERGEVYQEQRECKGGETTDLSVKLEQSPILSKKRLSLTLVSLGSAAFIAGLITGGLAWSSSNELDECRKNFRCSREQGELDLAEEVRGYSTTADLLTGTGLLVGVVGGVLYWLYQNQNSPIPPVQITPIPGGAAAFGTLSF